MKLFITGTDTEVGKTYTSVRLLEEFNNCGFTTLGLKPVASGSLVKDGKVYNADTVALHKAATIKLDHQLITPFCFETPVAPHLLAKEQGQHLNVKNLSIQLEPALTHPADICLIEGFGGWHAPLNTTETMADFVSLHQFNVILVIGIRLGCMNHGILTYQAIQQRGLNLVGWIANCINPNMLYRDENIASLQDWLKSPCLGITYYGKQSQFSLKKIVDSVHK